MNIIGNPIIGLAGCLVLDVIEQGAGVVPIIGTVSLPIVNAAQILWLYGTGKQHYAAILAGSDLIVHGMVPFETTLLYLGGTLGAKI